MRSFDRELVDRRLAVAHILTPPFDKTEPSPGYIQGYPPGIGRMEANIHTVLFGVSSLGADLEMGTRRSSCSTCLTQSCIPRLPLRSESTSASLMSWQPMSIRRSRIEVTPAGPGIRVHLAGCIRRASNGFLACAAGVNGCSFAREFPAEWPGFSATYKYKSTEYRITVNNPSHKSSGQTQLSVDGQEVDLGDSMAKDGPFIRLQDDHLVHEIILTM